jgi:hypothetical protein
MARTAKSKKSKQPIPRKRRKQPKAKAANPVPEQHVDDPDEPIPHVPPPAQPVWVPDYSQTSNDAALVAAYRSRLGAAVQSMAGEFKTPQPLAATFAGVGELTAAAQIIPAPIPVTPTVYPDQPDGTVIVQNHITINVRSAEFGELNKKLDELLALLRRSNEISGEVRDQLIAEIAAGRTLLTAPKRTQDLSNYC